MPYKGFLIKHISYITLRSVDKGHLFHFSVFWHFLDSFYPPFYVWLHASGPYPPRQNYYPKWVLGFYPLSKVRFFSPKLPKKLRVVWQFSHLEKFKKWLYMEASRQVTSFEEGSLFEQWPYMQASRRLTSLEGSHFLNTLIF